MSSKLKKIVVISIVIIVGLFLILSGGEDLKRLSFATAGTGGTYYPMGGGIASLLSKKTEGIEVSSQTSGGSAENLRLIENGDVDMAWANGSEIYWAWNGEQFFDNNHKNIRIVSFSWTNTYHFAALEQSGINSVKEFTNKKIGIGPQGSGAAIFATTFLKHVGLWDEIEAMYLPPADQTTSLKDGGIDVFGYFSGIPMAAMMDIASVKDINILDLQDIGEVSNFTEKYPFYIRTTIPANTYNGQEKNIGSYSNLTYWVASKELSEEIVYKMMKTLYSKEGLEHMINVHSRSKELAVENIQKGIESIGVPLHPGAIKFLEEKGIELKQ